MRILFFFIFSTVFGLNANNLNISEFEKTQQQLYLKLQAIQQEIDNLDNKNRELFYLYTQYQQELEYYTQENNLLSQKVEKQYKYISELNSKLKNIEQIEIKIPSLVSEMFELLSKSIKNDVPFMLETRLSELNKLKELIDDVSVPFSKKYSKLLDLYLKELNYSFNANAYDEMVQIKNANKEFLATFVQVGRIGFYYIDKTGKNGAFWNIKSKKWQLLPTEFLQTLKQNIQVIKKEKPIDLVTLIIPVDSINSEK
jgi:DNA repair exonuclease SbcCD ATPase subunit